MSRDNFAEVFTLTDPDNMISATVTCSKNRPFRHLSCAFQRNCVVDDMPNKSFWLQLKHLVVLQKLLPKIIERMDKEEKKMREPKSFALEGRDDDLD